ncbi:hypothetical protein Mal4_49490 [Maioricimonas rarisocia]|uniref:Uncharacterized protein n=1 Tax=Maioricimonas rarisocia TaxID=2528026 RepID=A0A517ZDN8_9PLAN|nr:hypothetical protein Mal4_49490 [Maioricimonas rarisocia]
MMKLLDQMLTLLLHVLWSVRGTSRSAPDTPAAVWNHGPGPVTSNGGSLVLEWIELRVRGLRPVRAIVRAPIVSHGIRRSGPRLPDHLR